MLTKEQVVRTAHDAGMLPVYYNRSSFDTEVSAYTPNLVKFAELIVQECMWKIMLRKEEAIDNSWHVDEAMSAAISDISEHFGVEQ